MEDVAMTDAAQLPRLPFAHECETITHVQEFFRLYGIRAGDNPFALTVHTEDIAKLAGIHLLRDDVVRVEDICAALGKHWVAQWLEAANLCVTKYYQRAIQEHALGVECGYVYLIHETGRNNTATTMRIKIGKSIRPKLRRSNLQTGASDELVILASVYSHKYSQLEKSLHALFKQYHVCKEWFDLPHSVVVDLLKN